MRHPNPNQTHTNPSNRTSDSTTCRGGLKPADTLPSASLIYNMTVQHSLRTARSPQLRDMGGCQAKLPVPYARTPTRTPTTQHGWLSRPELPVPIPYPRISTERSLLLQCCLFPIPCSAYCDSRTHAPRTDCCRVTGGGGGECHTITEQEHHYTTCHVHNNHTQSRKRAQHDGDDSLPCKLELTDRIRLPARVTSPRTSS